VGRATFKPRIPLSEQRFDVAVLRFKRLAHFAKSSSL